MHGPLGRLARWAAVVHPVIVGGSEDRVRLGERVVLSGAILNVASGTITIGDHSFVGLGVAMITGTHDISQRGAARKATVPQSGRDIVIGRGVFVASNSTILGPCTIGDDAVVAAGAVVRGDVAAATIVGGVPARPLREFEFG